MQSQPEPATAARAANYSIAMLLRVTAAFILAGFSLYTAFFGIMSDMIQRSVHLGLVLVLVYLGALVPSSLGLISNRSLRVLSVLLAVVGLATMMYQVYFFDEIASRYGQLTQAELYIGIIATFTISLWRASRGYSYHYRRY